MEKQSLLLNKLTAPINSLSIDKSELRKLFNILQERSHAAGKIELENFRQLDQTDENYEQDKENLKNGFKLKLSLAGSDGQELFGTIEEVFDSPNFPDQVKSIYVDSAMPLRVSYHYNPRNSFVLSLDFSKPALFNLSFLPSQATPNGSNILVQGYDSTWVHGVYSEFDAFGKRSLSHFKWVHKHSVYDLLVWGFGLPFGFWATYRLSNLVTKIFANFSTFVQSAAYVYVFLAALIVFRLLFHYARWVWPVVEYRSPRNTASKHRKTLVALALGLVGMLIYDLFRAVF